MPYSVMFVKSTVKNKDSKFSRKNANCSFLIISVDIIVSIIFSSLPLVVSTVCEFRGVVATRLPRLIKEAQRSILIFSKKHMIFRAEAEFDTT